MENHILIYIIAIIVLVFFSAFFSSTETAFTSLNRIRIKNLAGEGDARAKKVLDLSDQYDNLLSTLLIGNNIVNITMTAIATVLFVQLFGSYGATLSTIVITLVVLIFGEISPKSVAKEKPEDFAMSAASFTHFLMVLFTPVNFLFAKWKQLIIKMLRLNPGGGITEDELITMIEEAETEGCLDTERSELIQNAIEFNALEAWDVLTPRVDVVAIDIDTPKDEIVTMFRDTGFSRLPVYGDDIDNILGVLNQKDFHNYLIGNDTPIEEYVKPVIFAPGTMKLPVLLKKLQSTKTHIAVIINEYGGMDGIVTLEDIIEELVGEIYDEHDTVVSQDILPLYDGSYRVRANTNLEKFFDFFDLEVEIDAVTVNGWVVRELDKLPKVGDKFERTFGNKLFKAKVTKADERKALEINLIVETLPEEEEK